MLREMSSAEFSLWMAEHSISPIGAERDDFRSAQIAATMVNMWRGKGSDPVTVADFMPFTPKPKAKRKDTLRPFLTMIAKRKPKSGKRR